MATAAATAAAEAEAAAATAFVSPRQDGGSAAFAQEITSSGAATAAL